MFKEEDREPGAALLGVLVREPFTGQPAASPALELTALLSLSPKGRNARNREGDGCLLTSCSWGASLALRSCHSTAPEAPKETRLRGSWKGVVSSSLRSQLFLPKGDESKGARRLQW